MSDDESPSFLALRDDRAIDDVLMCPPIKTLTYDDDAVEIPCQTTQSLLLVIYVIGGVAGSFTGLA